MKKKIPFDISYREKIESGEVELTTNDGRRVRILKWDINSDRPIVAVIQAEIPDNGEDSVVCYFAEGTRQQGVGPSDLAILVEEEELTEFEEACRRALLDWCDPTEWTIENDFVREEAAKILDAARKALRTEFDEELEKAYRNQDEIVYQRGYDAGFEAGSAIDEERLTDRIAEKIAEKIVKDPFSPVPWTPPESPYEPITVMYGVTPTAFRPTADIVSTSASTTNTEDKNGKP